MFAKNYYYLISSLPALELEKEPHIDSEQFLDMAARELPESSCQKLARIKLVPGWLSSCQVEAQWQEWETYLRNLLVWRRCHHSGCESAHHWIRPETEVFPTIIRTVDEAVSEETPLAREKILDQLRWSRLDDLQTGHYFDFETLAIYRLRLLLAEKWRDHDTKRGREAFDGLIEHLLNQAATI